jgi:hypothetical protein
MSTNDDKNSVCSDKEEVEVKDKEEENEDTEEEDSEANEENEEEDDDEEDDDDSEDDDDDEFDPTIIQYELLKNFFVDEEGNNVATHLGSIAHELRRLNKILSKK